MNRQRCEQANVGLVQGRDERCPTNETHSLGKGKGNGGKGERRDGSKGAQQVENLVMDEGQENMRAMTSEEKEKNYKEDVRKLLEMVEKEGMELEMMQKEEMEQEKQRGRVAPNMGAGGSHPQANPREEEAEERKKETRRPRWADCKDDEGKGEEEQETEGGKQQEVKDKKGQEKEKETRPEKVHEEPTEERPPGLEEVESKQEQEQGGDREKEVEEKKEQEAERKQAPEKRKAQEEQEREEERTEQEREAEAQGGHESDVKAQEGHEGEVKAQEEQGEDANSLHEESHVSNRHITWWRNAWWVRVNNGPHLQTARDRRRAWRAATRAAREMRATQETQCESGETERERPGEMERKRKQHVAHRAAPTHQHNSINPTTTAAARSSCIQRLAVCDAVNASPLPLHHC